MKKVIIMKGLPGSGKSTFAKQLVADNPGMYKRLNKDELREMLDARHYTPENEKFVEKVRDLMLCEALAAGKHVIIDDTNLAERATERIQNVIKTYCAETGEKVAVEIRVIDTPLEECIKRDAKREEPVGKKVIMKMYKQHVLKNERGPHYQKQDETLTPAILCDLDGTLAILNGRSPYNGTECENDLLNEPVAEVLRTYAHNDTRVILLSGREDDARTQTENWLAKHQIPYDALFMREAGDKRRDAIVKKELYELHILNRYFIRFVLDDRDQVVDLWRLDLGLPCLQVNYGDF
ncbi:MAG: AAA family ATPase [Bacteroidia bacterium]|nr:AAA family ATPase [Bacteroidia bacterium]